MRIRKNVRLSSFMAAELIKPYDCQLNQSPWDVIDFSEERQTTLHQYERENNFTEEDGGLLGIFNGDNIGSGTITSLKEKVVVNVEDMNLDNEFGLKGKTDHDDLNIIEKMEATMLTPTARRSRSRPTKGTSNQDYEFYYYSGFGPSWGKKRSAQGNNNVVIIDAADEEQNQKNSDADQLDDETQNGSNKSVKARSLQSLM